MASDDPCVWAQAYMCCCPWPIDPTCCDVPGPDAPAADRDRFGRALAIASERLGKLTAGAYGLCEEVIRPCNEPCGATSPDWVDRWPLTSPYAGGILDPYVWEGTMRNRACGCVDDCECASVCKLRLPGPVAEIVEIKIDGQVVDPATYFVNGVGELVRRSPDCWPDCQHMDRPDTEDGTFSVRYLRGRDPGLDPDAVRAVTALTCELFKAMCGRKCRLPGRVRSITREGVTYEVLTDWKDRSTGLEEVDSWLQTVNPFNRVSPPTVTTPDLARPRYFDQDC